ncbi:MAG: hypothetical protein ACI9MR_003518, partial [Myxococcota bacterium]
FSQAFPRLFDTGLRGDLAAITSEVSAGTAAHYAANFQQAERHLQKAFELVYAQPELLQGDSVLLKTLADAAALRFSNATASGLSKGVAVKQLALFIGRFPALDPTQSDHPPTVIAAWDAQQAKAQETTGQLVVNVVPLELERAGGCRLHVNGADVARMPMASPLQLPAGVHMIQAACGLQRGWLQRVAVDGDLTTIGVPVRAMMAARAETRSGGVVLTRPSEGDAAALVSAISEATGFAGAVAVRTGTGRVDLGIWENGADGPSVDRRGRLEGDFIIDVKDASSSKSSGGRVWTWVAAGVGVGAIAGGVVANVLFNNEFDGDRDPDTLNSLESASVALYVTGGVLLGAAIVLFFVEGGDNDDPALADDNTRVDIGVGSVRLTF